MELKPLSGRGSEVLPTYLRANFNYEQNMSVPFVVFYSLGEAQHPKSGLSPQSSVGKRAPFIVGPVQVVSV